MSWSGYREVRERKQREGGRLGKDPVKCCDFNLCGSNFNLSICTIKYSARSPQPLRRGHAPRYIPHSQVAEVFLNFPLNYSTALVLPTAAHGRLEVRYSTGQKEEDNRVYSAQVVE